MSHNGPHCCETGGSGSGLAAFIGAGLLVLAVGAAVSAVLRAVAPLMPAIIGGEALAALGMITLAVLRLSAPGRSRSRGYAETEPRELAGYRVSVLPPEPARLYGPQSVPAPRRAALPGRAPGAPQRAGEPGRLPLRRGR